MPTINANNNGDPAPQDSFILKRILLINTGGITKAEKKEKDLLSRVFTQKFGFTSGTLTPYSGEQSYISPIYDGKRGVVSIVEYDPPFDDGNAGPPEWGRLCDDIEQNYNKYDAFLVLHCFETIAFTASALSFMLVNLNKSVILTGGRISITNERSDAILNITGAIQAAILYRIPEVCIFVDDALYRGNRITKRENLHSLHSPASLPLLQTGDRFAFNWWLVHQQSRKDALKITRITNSNVVVLPIFPGISPEIIDGVLKPPVEGCIVITNGNSLGSEVVRRALKGAIAKGVFMIHLIRGSRSEGLNVEEYGITPGFDMTIEAAVTKLMFLLSTESNRERIKYSMTLNLRGEISTSKKTKHSILQALQKSAIADSQHLLGFAACWMASTGDILGIKELHEDVAVDLNIADYDQRTPLHLAAAQNKLDIVRYLVKDAKVETNCKDRWGKTPLDEAFRYGHDEIANLLLESSGHQSLDTMSNNPQQGKDMLRVPTFGRKASVSGSLLPADMANPMVISLNSKSKNSSNSDGETTLSVPLLSGSPNYILPKSTTKSKKKKNSQAMQQEHQLHVAKLEVQIDKLKQEKEMLESYNREKDVKIKMLHQELQALHERIAPIDNNKKVKPINKAYLHSWMPVFKKSSKGLPTSPSNKVYSVTPD